ncbi:MAG TPA: dihydroneopterin aldolase, partial [Patescibacteria group bacterium]|nr:dihydroneopterin aldolase [Patescibacteria group bacterium]
DLYDASRSDSISDTIDYRELRAIARDVIEGPSMQLIEALAGRVADRVLTIPRVVSVSVRISKRPAGMMPIAGAAVHIKRTRG